MRLCLVSAEPGISVLFTRRSLSSRVKEAEAESELRRIRLPMFHSLKGSYLNPPIINGPSETFKLASCFRPGLYRAEKLLPVVVIGYRTDPISLAMWPKDA